MEAGGFASATMRLVVIILLTFNHEKANEIYYRTFSSIISADDKVDWPKSDHSRSRLVEALEVEYLKRNVS